MSHKKSLLFTAAFLSALTLTSCGNQATYMVAYNKYLERTSATANIQNLEGKVEKCWVFNVKASILTEKIDEKTGEPVIDEKTGEKVYIEKSIAANYYFKLKYDGTVHPYKGVDDDVYYITYESDSGAMYVTPKVDDYNVALELYNSGEHEIFDATIKGEGKF